MEPIKVHVGRTVPLMNDNIDTDQIIPKSFLKRIEKTGFGKYAFDEWRHLPDGSVNPDFNPTKPEYTGATILVTGDNFGCGSSREHAAWALKDFGFRIILAGSYGDIFYMNSTKNGLLPIVLPLDARQMIAELPPKAEITVDLPNQKVITPVGTFEFEIDATWKEKLVKGLDDIALTLEHEALIEAYEAKIPSYWQ